MDNFSTDIHNTGFKPFSYQSQKRLIIDAIFEHTDHPIMINVVEKPFDVRLNNPIVFPKLQVTRQVPYRIPGTCLGPDA